MRLIGQISWPPQGKNHARKVLQRFPTLQSMIYFLKCLSVAECQLPHHQQFGTQGAGERQLPRLGVFAFEEINGFQHLQCIATASSQHLVHVGQAGCRWQASAARHLNQ